MSSSDRSSEPNTKPLALASARQTSEEKSVEDTKPGLSKRKRQSDSDSPRKRTITAWTSEELEVLFDQITEGKRGKDIVVPGRTGKQAHDIWI